jgi:DNA-binding XRE family transcriptional regulator
MLKVSIIKDHTGSPVGVVLPFEIFRQLAEQAESTLSDEDLAALVLATHDPNEETWPAALVNRLLDGENPLHVYRTYRGLSQKGLAEKAGCTANYISQLESGRRVMSPIMASSLASILGIDADDLLDPPEAVSARREKPLTAR